MVLLEVDRYRCGRSVQVACVGHRHKVALLGQLPVIEGGSVDDLELVLSFAGDDRHRVILDALQHAVHDKELLVAIPGEVDPSGHRLVVDVTGIGYRRLVAGLQFVVRSCQDRVLVDQEAMSNGGVAAQKHAVLSHLRDRSRRFVQRLLVDLFQNGDRLRVGGLAQIAFVFDLYDITLIQLTLYCSIPVIGKLHGQGIRCDCNILERIQADDFSFHRERDLLVLRHLHGIRDLFLPGHMILNGNLIPNRQVLLFAQLVLGVRSSHEGFDTAIPLNIQLVQLDPAQCSRIRLSGVSASGDGYHQRECHDHGSENHKYFFHTHHSLYYYLVALTY